MITRSKRIVAIRTQQGGRRQNKMESQSDIIPQQKGSREDAHESEEINNQLGIEGIYDEIQLCPINANGPERQIAHPDAEVREEVTRDNPESSDKGAWGQNRVTSKRNDFEMILSMLQGLKEASESQNQQLKEEIQKQNEERKRENQAIREEIKETRRENLRMIQEIRSEIKVDMGIIKEEGEKTRAEVKENREAINNLKAEVATNKQQLVTNTNNLSENLNRINTELRSEIRANKEETKNVRKTQGEIGEQVKKMEEEKKRRIDEIRATQEQITRRVNEIEARPNNRAVNAECNRDVTFNGIDSYPMEFLKELKDIKEAYYAEDDVKWIRNHLTEGAMLWWRIIKHEINNFTKFEEKFIEKYWGAHIQEDIRDRLEYGKFRYNGNLNPIQYMERQILQCRQIVPAITDSHMIRKLARHYDKEVELAVMTRGIKDIPQFENLLREYMQINGNKHERNRHGANHYVVKREESERVVHTEHKGSNDKRKFQHKDNFRNQSSTEVNHLEAIPSCSGISKNLTTTPGVL